MAVIGAEALRPLPSALAAPTASLGPGWSASRIEDEAGLQALGAEWRALLAASPADELFLTPEWLGSWWRHVGRAARGARLALVAVRRNGHLVALAPFERSAPAGEGRFGPPTYRFLGRGQVGSDYLDLVARRGDEVGALVRVAEELERAGAVVDLEQVRRERSSAALLAGLLVLRGWRALERVTHVCPYVELAGHDWDGFVASLGASHRANLRRRLRKLEASHEVRFTRVERVDELDRAFDELLDLHRRRWSERGGSDGLADPALIAFHRDFARQALSRGWLRLQRLELDGRTAAALYGFRYGRRFLFYQSGFDPALADQSVGLVCLALSIRSALEEGATEYDLLHGEEAYKSLWASGTRELVRLELYPPSASGRFRYGLRRSTLAAKRRLRRYLRRGEGRTG